MTYMAWPPRGGMEGMTPRLSLQLYTVREALGEDFDGTIAKIASYGFRHVEPYGIDTFADQLVESLARHGLDAPTSHGNPVTGDLAATIEGCHKVGVQRIIQPGSPRELWTSVDGVKQWAAQLNTTAAKAKAEGLTFGYHNHAFELEAVFDGVHALDILAGELDPEIGLEIDTYWSLVGGADTVALLKRLGERVVALHIKDGDGSHENKNQVAVGAGSVPVLDYLAAAPHVADAVVELDDTTGDMLAAVRDSYTYLADKEDWA